MDYVKSKNIFSFPHSSPRLDVQKRTHIPTGPAYTDMYIPSCLLYTSQCRARVIKWCNQYGLPLDEESPGTGSSLERFIFSLLYLSTKFHELQEGYRSDRAFKYVMSGRLIYDIDIIEGVPKMSVVFKSVVELAQLQRCV